MKPSGAAIRAWTPPLVRLASRTHRRPSWRLCGGGQTPPKPVQAVIGRQVVGIPGATFEERFCSKDVDPEGKEVEDAWAQSITVMKSEQDDHLITVLMRSAANGGSDVRMVAIQDRDDADYGPTGTHTEQRVTTDGSSAPPPFGWEQDWGLYTGITTFQRCDPAVAGCPFVSAFNYPQLGMMAVWTDPRNTSTTINDTFVRAFTW